MAKISIIVPVYNVEKYIRKCIESIRKQTFRAFEVILVDDGSTDGSGRICDEYARLDTRVKVIHTENSGLSAARNYGIQETESEYITFIDSDDYIDNKYLEILYQVMLEYNADLVMCHDTSFMGERVSEIRFNYKDIVSNAEIIPRIEAYRRMLLNKQASITAWGKLYHKKIFQSVRYPVGEIYEDSKVIDRIIENSNKIVYIPYRGYFYRVREGSVTHGKTTLEHMTCINNAHHLLSLIRDHYPDIEYAAKINYTQICYKMISGMADERIYMELCQYLRKEILKEGKEFFWGKYTNLGMKCSMICLWIGLPFYRVVRKVFYSIVSRV